MRVPTFDRFRKFMQALAFFVCGMIVGSAVFNVLKNVMYENVALENIRLKTQLSTMEQDLKFAQQSHKENVISQIKIIFLQDSEKTKSKLDILTETRLKTQLKNDLKIFLGRSIYEIDSDSKFARMLLSKKTYDIEETRYRVVLDTMLVVDGTLQVWASAEKGPRT
ncbi:hypothetical protein D7Z26_06840 [Cohnella endophytica]|uniref:Sporulation membrane protein YtrI C-terminal domain-containing protein n=1 Tax=Cohnella endophytica TaxID=2419778 RepID=A0A494XYB1_9BACL|nr:hypothetical protein [Cohnella endophytica]RKP54949.1 hypothetical protein D7Z26_06840 [Cohnella endophytica]